MFAISVRDSRRMQWQYKSIGKEVKALEHNFTVACDALPACLEVLVTRYDALTDDA